MIAATDFARADSPADGNGLNLNALVGKCAPNEGSLGFVLRQDFTDISLFDCPAPDLKNAVGSRVLFDFR